MQRLPVLLLLGFAGCSTSGPSVEPRHPRPRAKASAAAHAQQIAALSEREHDPQPVHQLALLGGLATARVESRVAPRPECDDEDSCRVVLELGDVPIADTPATIACTVSTVPEEFGQVVKALQGSAWLVETPRLATRALGSGVVVDFVGNGEYETEDGPFPVALKLSAFYAGGYSAFCMDALPGGRATFERVAHGYFSSLKLAPNPRFPDLFELAYRRRVGDQTVGFSYGLLARRDDGEDGFAERTTFFAIRTDEASWSVSDLVHTIRRDGHGRPESSSVWASKDGGTWVSVSAKPAEDGRFRVKWAAGQRSDALELTPKAPLSSELWSAVELRQIARGRRKSFRYAIPSFDDGDPSLGYVELSRLRRGVVGQRARQHGDLIAGRDKSSDLVTELHVDERGIVVKEVRTLGVSELIHSAGTASRRTSGAGMGRWARSHRGRMKFPRCRIRTSWGARPWRSTSRGLSPGWARNRCRAPASSGGSPRPRK